MAQPLVARFRDGRVLKGRSMDVDANRPRFHLRPEGGGPVEDVTLADLKALFFVRSFEGNPEHEEKRTLDPGDPRARGATLVRASFADGEEIVGLTIRFPPNRNYYFLIPVDPASNNVRILVNGDAVASLDAVETGG
jgi:hypothetical protein